MNKPRPAVICLTPTKNEAHNLPRFLACASLWADHIIVADQGSTDGTRDIIRQHPKAILVENNSPDYSEVARQRLLIDAARKIPGPRLLVTLDADEMISAEIFTSPRWQEALDAAPGTVIWFHWVNILPGFKKAWMPLDRYPWAYMDDGAQHVGAPIHSPRVPVPPGAPAVLLLKDLPVLHYAYVDWNRLWWRARWYQCWEVLNSQNLGPVRSFRRYHEFLAMAPTQIVDFREDWIRGYEAAGIPMCDFVPIKPDNRWNREIVDWLVQHGPRKFARVDIWDEDWSQRYADFYGHPSEKPLRMSRRLDEHLAMWWLAKTQRYRLTIPVRLVDRALRMLGW